MDSKIVEFINKQRVCAFTTILIDNSPHAAAMHFSYNTDPLEIYIQTENSSKKCEAILNGDIVKGSFVIGFGEEEFVTFQADGDVIIIKDQKELEKVHKIHYFKNPDAEQWKDDPATVFLIFKPTWWRYTEYKPKFMAIESK